MQRNYWLGLVLIMGIAIFFVMINTNIQSETLPSGAILTKEDAIRRAVYGFTAAETLEVNRN